MGRRLQWRVIVATSLGVVCGAAAAAWLADAFRNRGDDGVADAAKDKAYLVQRVSWQYTDRSEPYRESEPSGAGYPEKVFFADRAAAEAYRHDREREERKGRCPFEHGRGWGRSYPSLEDFTSTPTGEFIDWLAAEGLDPPARQRAAWATRQGSPETATGFVQSSFDDWRMWWDANFRSREGEPDCDRIWDKLDRVRFFEVFEVELVR